ncbi:MAG TPA: bifunctional YncE family protein/alkaline phosphatase family protein [Terriglobales bacterium]|nr:bifunctional YncE family protein/alkaline phosphatase family protein [Terriglobales bacterium]
MISLALGYEKKISQQQIISLPSSKRLLAPPGNPQPTNGLPVATVLDPSGRYLALLNAGFGTAESHYRQSVAILDLQSNQLTDFPDPRLGPHARQAIFLGLAFSPDGGRLYATVGSITDPNGRRPDDTGNGIIVYRLERGKVSPQSFISVGLQPISAGKHVARLLAKVPPGQAIPYPAGIAAFSRDGREELLVANNLSDNAVLLDGQGKLLRRFDLSAGREMPSAYPYTVAVTRDGRRAFCSLWNASEVAELDLEGGKVTRRIALLKAKSATEAGSHPTAMLLSGDDHLLFVTLSNSDAVAVVDVKRGKLLRLLSTRLPGQAFGGTFPNALAESSDGKLLFVADASSDAVAVFDISALRTEMQAESAPQPALGFIPTQWYPTALAARGDDLLIASGKGEGTGPNSDHTHRGNDTGYIPTLLRGSIARVSVSQAQPQLAGLTLQVEQSNLMKSDPGQMLFRSGKNPIRHVIYIIKENRTYDQILGDLKAGDGDPSLTMFGEDVTPNEHALARQFGILDNFYDSGEVSGDGHVWSTAGITSDYTEKTWQLSYRGYERSYDYEGEVAGDFPLQQGTADVNEPESGYLWGNLARHGLTYRHYGEYVTSIWCGVKSGPASPRMGTPEEPEEPCRRPRINQGEPLPPNLGQPHGSRSPWPWPVPMLARDVPTKPELRGHFDPHYADFRLDFPDQLRVDDFLNEFQQFVRARQQGAGEQLPAFTLLRLPNDHTAGTRPDFPTPAASVADNDLALGRVVEAVSHSPYWDDTIIFALEDDAQDGADHVDAHRSIAFVISKYSPGSAADPYVDHHFYTTVSVIHTMEALLNLPPMNNNDALAPLMAPLFSWSGQPPFKADYRNRDNGLLYRMNSPKAPGAQASMKMDFTHADAAPARRLNAILWRDRMGSRPMPAPKYSHN